MLTRYGILFCLYFFGGGLVFMELESDNAKTLKSPKQELGRFREKLTAQFNISYEELDSQLQKFIHSLQQLNALRDPYTWNYYESCFFAGSILTTIGYGHLYPRTPQGQIFTVFYALFGIPLTLLLLRKLGDKITKQIYRVIERMLREPATTQIAKDDTASDRGDPDLKDAQSKNTNIKEKCQALKEKVLHVKTPEGKRSDHVPPRLKLHVKASLLTVIAIAVLIVIFVLMSAVVRVYAESWSMRESTYFWIVTLLTIGFGDFVPYDGRAPPSEVITAVYYVGTFYLLLGLALVTSFIQAVSTLMEGRLPKMRVKSFRSLRKLRKGAMPKGKTTSVANSDDENPRVSTIPRASTVSIIVNTNSLEISASPRRTNAKSIPITLS